jgi:hypothetical protein
MEEYPPEHAGSHTREKGLSAMHIREYRVLDLLGEAFIGFGVTGRIIRLPSTR